MEVFSGNTANDVWENAMCSFQTVERDLQPSRCGNTKEILKAIFEIANPTQRWVWSIDPPRNPAFAIADLIWILRGCNDSAFLNYWFPGLPSYAGNAERYHGAYGYRLRTTHNLDQLERAYEALKHTPDSRQVVLQTWNPLLDFPDERGERVDADIPCNVCALLKIRSGLLEWTQIVRSNDIYHGVPTNFVQFTSLQEIIAGWLDLGVGSYVQLSDSLHVYEDDMAAATIQPVSKIYENTDSLRLSKVESDNAFEVLEKSARIMVSNSVSSKELMSMLSECGLQEAYRNLLCVLAAEHARKQGWIGESQAAIDICSNGCLTELWTRWRASREKQRCNTTDAKVSGRNERTSESRIET